MSIWVGTCIEILFGPRRDTEITFKSLKLVLIASGPGVFLALFGTYLIFTIVNHRVELGSEQNLRQPTGFLKPPFVFSVDENAKYLMPVSLKEVNQGQSQIDQQKNNIVGPCTIYIRHRSLSSGNDAPQPAAIISSLDFAIETLRAQSQPNTDPQTRAKYAATVAILRQLQKGVVE